MIASEKKPVLKENKKRNVLVPEHEDLLRRSGFDVVIGVDEAGRGPLAGPVVAAAVSLTDTCFPFPINDSKKMSPSARERAFDEILARGYVGVGIMSEAVIDDINILQATFCAMQAAVEDMVGKMPSALTHGPLFIPRVCVLVDGDKFSTTLPYAYRTIVKGDSSVLSIACASVIAKVTRDRIMQMYDKIFPHYGFSQHKGYPTAAHKAVLRARGYSPIHRKTFSF